ncbi:MAG: 5-bromo-4-chloroindolyl phosphate hydrolysis family protein [Eubacteriales bacterium]|nr:5-bromo-4-chloroindolyl phosphate hydrolysis family protein [Eubacteriales bacterium]
MPEQNWNEIGSNISKAVSEAIDTGDFGKLNQTIQDTMRYTTGRLYKAAGDQLMQAQARSEQQAQQAQMRSEQQAQQAQARKAQMAQAQARAEMKKRRYSVGQAPKTRSYTWTVLGVLGLIIFGSMEMSLGGISILTSLSKMLIPMLVIAAGFLFSIYAVVHGSHMRATSRLFQQYVELIGDGEMISVDELAGRTGKDRKATLKEIRSMLQNGLFREGVLDAEEKYLFVTREAYEGYQNSMNMIRQKQEAQQKAEKQEQKRKQEAQTQSEARRDGLSEEVLKVINEGESYVRKIRSYNERISDERISEKLNGLESVTGKIFEYVEEHPESASETKKLLRYYLPTMERLLESYVKLDDSPTQGANIEKSRRDIEQTLDTLNEAFARLFDNLYQDTSINIASDISVLNTLLAQEGLTGKQMGM